MRSGAELRIEHENLIRSETRARFPLLDPNLVVRIWLVRMYRDAKRTAEILALMAPEVRRMFRAEQERADGQTEA